MTHIAVDLLGGDLGSPPFVLGAIQALESNQNLSLTLVGQPDMSVIPEPLKQRVSIVEATEVVEMQDSPTSAIRKKPDSSMAKAIRLLKDNSVDAVVSAGNTGALVGFGLQVLGMAEGISRPAISAAIPTAQGKTWMLDIGATLNSSTERLLELASVGAALVRVCEQKSKPRVAVLNVGSEEIKGTLETRQAAEQMAQAQDYEFSGYVEGDSLFAGNQDVIICDGFSGNIAIKTAQGLSRLLNTELDLALRSSMATRALIGLLKPVIGKFAKRINPSLYNGAPLLGLNGLIVKSHGSADQQAFANAILVAADMAKQELVAAVNADVRV